MGTVVHCAGGKRPGVLRVHARELMKKHFSTGNCVSVDFVLALGPWRVQANACHRAGMRKTPSLLSESQFLCMCRAATRICSQV